MSWRGTCLTVVGRLERTVRAVVARSAVIATPRRVAALLKILILLQILLVLATASRHEPWFAFEESHTLRLASLPPEDIADVLTEDQNFPLYYRILHEIDRAIGSDGSRAIAFNFASWILSLIVFHILAREVIGPGSGSLLATLIFATTPSIFQYAYYVRMYAQSNLLFLITLLAIARYARHGRTSWLVCAGLALIGGSFLHPVGGLCAILCFVAAFPVARGVLDRVAITALAGSAVLVAIIETLGKNDFRRLYLESGTQYVREISTPLHTFTGLLLGRTQGAYSWVYFVLGVILLCFFFARTPLFRRTYFPLAVFNGAFVLFHLVLPGYSNAHHYYFFTAPLVLALVIGLLHAARGDARWTWLAVVLPVVFLGRSYEYCRESDDAVRRHEALDAAMRKLPEGPIVTDFIVHDMVHRAIPRGSRRIFILRDDALVETTGLSLEEVLLIQAKLGGLPGSGVATGAYRSRLSKALAGKDSPLRRQANELAAGSPSVFFVLPLNRSSLFPEELEIFKTAPFRELIRPTIYRFARTEP